MRIAIFGASGATGKELVRQAIAAKHSVTAFVRDTARLPISDINLRVIQGDVADEARVHAAIASQDAVICTLGVGKPLTHDPVVIRGVRHIVTSMRQSGVRRFIYLSFIGVEESRAAAGFLLRHVARIPLRHEIADHESKEAIVKESGLDWTIVRPPKFTSGPRTDTFRAGEDIAARSILPTLSRADAASFMLTQLANATYVRKAVRILP